MQTNTLDFLNQLRNNNNKGWFDAHRKDYERAKADVLALLTNVLRGLEEVDPALAAAGLDVKSCLFRMNRDVRFSTDKSPYKTNFAAWFNVGGKKSPSAGYYLNLEPGNSFIAGGVYTPEPTVLSTIRQEIDYNLAGFEAILSEPTFQTYFGELSREDALINPPKGYKADNPAVDYLKLKSFTAISPLADTLVTSPELTDTVVGAYRGLQPLITFLNRALVSA